MTEPRRYAVDLEALEASARVAREDQVEEQDVRPPHEQSRSEGHLPGGLRPFAV